MPFLISFSSLTLWSNADAFVLIELLFFSGWCFTQRALIAGGGAPEIELAVRLAEYSRTLGGMEAYCVRAYSDALEVIPSTLAENAGLNPISTVTELRNRHAQGDKMAGINVRKVSAASLQGCIHNSMVVSAWCNSLFFNV